MKSKLALGRFKRKLFARSLAVIFLSFLAVTALVYVVEVLFHDDLSNFLNAFFPTFYRFLRRNELAIIILFYGVVLLSSVYWTVARTTRYIDLLVGAIDQMMSREGELIQLPADFREVQNQLNDLQMQALKAERVAQEAEQRKNDLVVYLAHDLKTPLTSVIGYLTLLQDEPDLPQAARARYTGIALDKAERLELLINEFFEITRFSLQHIVLNPWLIDLNLMLEQLVDEFYPVLTPKGLSIDLTLEPHLTLVGDGDKLARVFDNLLRNAINYCDPDTALSITARAQDGGVRLWFLNRGPQIPEHQLSSIFEKFYRLDASRSTQSGGSGLGLAISKEIVEAHGGAIEATSTPEATVFTLWLPNQPA